MIKTIIYIKKRPDVSYEDFAAHWKGRHAQLVLKLPGMKRYVQNHVRRDLMRGEPKFDGVAESWFDSMDDVSAVIASDAYKDVQADEPNFIDQSQTQYLIVEELEPTGS